jgi:hypothetical protein
LESREKIMQKRRTNRLIKLGGWVLAGMLAWTGVVAPPQASAAQARNPNGIDQPGQNAIRSLCADCTVVREIDDPHSGRQWLLLRDTAHPSGPGLLVSKDSVQSSDKLEGAIVRLHPVIRAGDRLTVEQSNAKFDLRLEGVALSPAAPGVVFRVRLVLGGKVVEAVALAPGRAAGVPDKEFWP